jgi:hypothetical protein
MTSPIRMRALALAAVMAASTASNAGAQAQLQAQPDRPRTHGAFAPDAALEARVAADFGNIDVVASRAAGKDALRCEDL